MGYPQKLFVRGQDQIARLKSSKATGWVFSEKEVLEIFGQKVIEEVDWYGSAIIVCHPAEPARTFRKRREFLNITVEELSRCVCAPLQEVLDAEDPAKRSSIHLLIRIAKVLGLDPRFISWKEGKEELGYLYPE
jgi:hypothetical protein